MPAAWQGDKLLHDTLEETSIAINQLMKDNWRGRITMIVGGDFNADVDYIFGIWDGHDLPQANAAARRRAATMAERLALWSLKAHDNNEHYEQSRDWTWKSATSQHTKKLCDGFFINVP